MSSEFNIFVKNFIKEVKTIMRKKITIADSVTTKWKIERKGNGMGSSFRGMGFKYETTNPRTDGLHVSIRFGSEGLNVSQTSYHIGWSSYHTISYADPRCTPDKVADMIIEIPDAFMEAYNMCKEEADEFNIEIRKI